jgi:hypothetical protein
LIDGQEVEIATDFRVCLRTIMAFENNDLAGTEKQAILMTNLYPVIPDNQGEAFRQGVKFLNGGKEPEESDETPARLYSFEKDANLIFAAFQQTHGIDLETAQMHWWKFMALFMDLGSETTWCNLVGLRKRVKNGTASKEERTASREMGDMFDVADIDNRTLDERIEDEAFQKSLMAWEK